MKRGGGFSGGGGNANGGGPPLLSPSSRKVPPPSPTSGLGSLSLNEKEAAGAQEFASTTTFVQVDTSSFRELVQKLTGASDSDVEKLPITLPSRQASRGGADAAAKMDNTFGGLIPKPVGDLSARRPAFKLHERRQSNLRKLDVKGLGAAAAFRRGVAGYGGGSPTPDLSPKFPSCIASPVTPLTKDVFESAHAPTTPTSYEGYTQRDSSNKTRLDIEPHFYLHPPRNGPGNNSPSSCLYFLSHLLASRNQAHDTQEPVDVFRGSKLSLMDSEFLQLGFRVWDASISAPFLLRPFLCSD